ncbi:hypothetical protein [Gordonia malaquae]|uniref:hypothetical protein n=1 Tax=Gordonia malaquae TaxID=410332 RepID=UPI0030FE500D
MEYLNEDILFNTVSMLSDSGRIVLVVEGVDDRHALESHVSDCVDVICGTGGKVQLLNASMLVDERRLRRVKFLVDRDYDSTGSSNGKDEYSVLRSTNHDVFMDLLESNDRVFRRVVSAHNRGRISTRDEGVLESILSEAISAAMPVGMLRKISVSNDWGLNLSDFPFGKMKGSLDGGASCVVDIALGRSNSPIERELAVNLLSAAMDECGSEIRSMVSDHDFFSALSLVLDERGFRKVSSRSLSDSFFAAIDCDSLSGAAWFRELNLWCMEIAEVSCFGCPCEVAA